MLRFDDFWTFRKRVYDAVVKSEAQLDLDGSEEWSKVVAAYNEVNGEDQFNTDNAKLRESMSAWGNSTQLWTFLMTCIPLTRIVLMITIGLS